MSMSFDAVSEPLSRRVASGLAKIGLALKAKAWKGATPAGLTPSQGHALSLLSEERSGMKLAALAQALGVSAPTASEMVNAMVAKGYAAKAQGPDKRSIALTLTPAGEALAERAAGWPDFLARAVETLTPSEQAVFLTGLTKIVRALQEHGDIAPQRMCVTCRYFRPNAHADADNPHHCAFVDAPFGERHLRLNCPEHVAAQAA